MYSPPDISVISSSFNSIRNKDTSSSYPARIEARSITFPALTLNPAKVVDRFSAVFSTSSKSLT
jgi:hypothetical protein